MQSPERTLFCCLRYRIQIKIISQFLQFFHNVKLELQKGIQTCCDFVLHSPKLSNFKGSIKSSLFSQIISIINIWQSSKYAYEWGLWKSVILYKNIWIFVNLHKNVVVCLILNRRRWMAGGGSASWKGKMKIKWTLTTEVHYEFILRNWRARKISPKSCIKLREFYRKNVARINCRSRLHKLKVSSFNIVQKK